MINGFRYTREEIITIIKTKCEKTKEGIYWTPNIVIFLAAKGLETEKQYVYKREDFFNKLYFTKTDLKYFLAKEEFNNYEYNMMKRIDKSFLDNNFDTFNLKLRNKVKPYDFNVGELLNSFIYLKYASFNITI